MVKKHLSHSYTKIRERDIGLATLPSKKKKNSTNNKEDEFPKYIQMKETCQSYSNCNTKQRVINEIKQFLRRKYFRRVKSFLLLQ